METPLLLAGSPVETPLPVFGRLAFGCANSSGSRLQEAPLDFLAFLPLPVSKHALQSSLLPCFRFCTCFASSVPTLHFTKHAVQHFEGFHRSQKELKMVD